jgi:CRP/FNR family transcriptional regulator
MIGINQTAGACRGGSASKPCRNCVLYQLCVPGAGRTERLSAAARQVEQCPPLARGEHVFRVDDPACAVYGIRAGSVKTYIKGEGTQERITGFHLPGDLIGIDAMGVEQHPCSAQALEPTLLCRVPFERLQEAAAQIPSLHAQICRLMSREIAHARGFLAPFARSRSDARLAAFLLSVQRRSPCSGGPPRELTLSMSRRDIGNYLGVAVETVSRLLSRFEEQGVLVAHTKRIRVQCQESLEALAAGIPPLGLP